MWKNVSIPHYCDRVFLPWAGSWNSQTSPRKHHTQTSVDNQVTRAVTLWGLQSKFSDLKWGFSGEKEKVGFEFLKCQTCLWAGWVCAAFTRWLLLWGARLGLAGTEPSWLLNSAENAQNLPKAWRNGQIFFSCYGLNVFRSQSVNWSWLQVFFLQSYVYVTNICCAHKKTLTKTKENQIRTKPCYYNQSSHCLFVNMPPCPRLKHFLIPRGRKSQTTEMWFWQLLFPFFYKSLKLLSLDVLYNFPGNYSEWQG